MKKAGAAGKTEQNVCGSLANRCVMTRVAKGRS
jgi:hypothetical protein